MFCMNDKIKPSPTATRKIKDRLKEGGRVLSVVKATPSDRPQSGLVSGNPAALVCSSKTFDAWDGWVGWVGFDQITKE